MTQKIVETSAKDFLRTIASKNAFLVFSPTTTRINKAFDEVALFEESCRTIISSHRIYESLQNAYPGYAYYIGFGGGTAIDIAKYLSYQNPASSCIAIPSMLSTNVFATNKTAAVYKTHKKTIDSKLPDTVIIDYNLLKESEKENTFGLADAFSIHTAMRDWLIADREGIESVDYRFLGWDASILYKAQEIVKERALPFPDKESIIKNTFDVLLQTGYITNEWGCGRPESGSEHVIAKCVEELVNVPHAIAVTCGIAIVSQLQENPAAVKELKELGMFELVRNSEVTRNILITALRKVQPRKGRYTVIDLWVERDGHLNDYLINKLVDNSGLYN